ncbi:MAG TPA: filamentous hemagglutinin N-terminal domain-containing protein, partial [Herbaspirillum sp.]|nr:filamentous hemagglutinin N-terminal domain-containing protein [Herbaspirillum sp.]
MSANMTTTMTTIPQRKTANARAWIAYAISCALIVQPMPALAQVTAAAGAAAANKPVVDVTANGRPLVQITAPNAAGVSNNQYSAYNVTSQGVILNNAQSTVLTQQGGYVGANPYLAAGGARIIVNQVVGGSASQLSGYTEVAGQQAEVVIANPAGIYCSGCGFINTTRGVLTTGTPVYGGSGSLDAFHVTGGQIQIDAGGLNGSNVDQVDLIARNVKINGQLWANQRLNVVTGANDVNYTDLSTQALTPDANKPSVAIDVAQLGGMYANKIKLVGTEAGVGVNSLGTIAAQAGDFTLNNQGQISLAGSTTASGNVQINAAGNVANSGALYAGQNADVSAQGQVSNSGTLAALGNVNLNGATVNSSGALGAGIDTHGNLTGNGNLTVSGAGAVAMNGQNLAGGNIAVNGSSLNLTGATTSAVGIATLTATGALLNNQGQVSATQLTVNAASLSNQGGTLTQTGTGDTALTIAGSLDNTNGVIASNAQNMTIRSGSLINQGGQINHAGTGALALYTGALTNNSGAIATNGQSTINAISLTNTSGAISAANALGINVTNLLDNSGGTLSATGALAANAAAFKNVQGNISGATVGLTIAQLDNSGGRILTNQLNVRATDLTNRGGTLTQFGIGAMTLAVSNALDNSNGGMIQTNSADLTLAPASLNNNGGTIMLAGTGALTIAPGNGAGTLSNVGGTLASNGQVAVSAVSFDNTGGTVSGQSNVIAGIAGALNNTRGTLRSNASLSATSGGALNNTGGTINAGGIAAANNNSTLNLSAVSVDNTGGSINNLGAGATTVSGTTQILNSNAAQATGMGSISGNGAVTLATAVLSNTQGGQVSGANLQINANSIDNSGGKIGNTPNASGNVGISTSGAVTNAGGRIGAARNLTIAASTLYGAGAFTAAGDVALNLQGDFDNAAGNQISAANNLTFTLPGNLTNAGSLLAVNNLNVSAANINNTGSMAAGGLLSTNSATLTNSGTIIGASVSLTASQSIANLGTTALIGATGSAGKLELLAPDIEN